MLARMTGVGATGQSLVPQAPNILRVGWMAKGQIRNPVLDWLDKSCDFFSFAKKRIEIPSSTPAAWQLLG